MAATTATSKVSPVVIGSGRGKSTTYVATKVTGPIKNEAGEDIYSSEIVQYDNAKGEGAKTIGTRDSETGDITWNENASGRTKLNESKFKKASNNQIESVQKELASTAAEKQALNKASGTKNQELAGNNNTGDTSSPMPTQSASVGDSSGLSGSDEGSEVARNSYGNHVYPTSLRTGQQDNLRISVLKHIPSTPDGLSFQEKVPGRPIGSVTLPVPMAVQDGNKTEWANNSMNAAQIAASGAVKGFLGDGGATEAAARLTNAYNDAMADGGQDVTTAMQNIFAENLTGTTDLLSRTTGKIMNPNMELLFKGPGMRSFSFSWKLTPRDKNESVEIAKIIRLFKQSMAPQKTTTTLFLKAPSIYKLQFNRGSAKHKFLPKMKTCALIDFGVNYTPDGSYMTYQTSSMVSYEMSMSFQGIDPIFNNDMSHSDGSIGY